MNSNYVAIAIDGPAASGKSTVAKALAKKLGFIFINSGAFYRALTWVVLQKKADPSDVESVKSILAQTQLVPDLLDGASVIRVDNQLLDSELHSDEVNASVSKIAIIPEAREMIGDLLRGFAQKSSLVMEGRDIGTVVFPDSPFKLYVDASEEVRMKRRSAQGQLDAITQRDKTDSTRKTAPLKVAEGAKVIDSSEMSVEEVVAVAVCFLEEKGLKL